MADNDTDDMPSQFRWRDVRHTTPPKNAHGLAVLVQVTCACGKGGQVALPAGRVDGNWVVGGFEHQFEIDYWTRLPEFPAPIVRQHRKDRHDQH